jgi:hypothetical protein
MPYNATASKRNVLSRLKPEERARVCLALRRYIEIEETLAATAKRNARLRMAIGLPPFPRRLTWKAVAEARRLAQVAQ